MIAAAVSTVLGYLGANIDDILLLTVFYAAAKNGKEKRAVTLGQFPGIGLLLLISLLGIVFSWIFSPRVLSLLGLIPIALGVRSVFRGAEKEDEGTAAPGTVPVALVALADGGDFVAVFLPLFGKLAAHKTAPLSSAFRILVCCALCLLMTGLFCFAGSKLASFPALRRFLEKCGPFLVPAVLILVGISILLLP